MGAEVLHPHGQPAGAAQQGEGGEAAAAEEEVTGKGCFPSPQSQSSLAFTCTYERGGFTSDKA